MKHRLFLLAAFLFIVSCSNPNATAEEKQRSTETLAVKEKGLVKIGG